MDGDLAAWTLKRKLVLSNGHITFLPGPVRLVLKEFPGHSVKRYRGLAVQVL